MSNSTVVNWLDENSVRAYPLTSDSNRYIHSVDNFDLYSIFVDAMFVFSAVIDPVKLTSIATTSNDAIFTIVTGSTTLNFTLFNYPAANYPVYVRDTNHNLLAFGPGTVNIPPSSSFTITGVYFEPTVSNEIPTQQCGVTSLTFNGYTFGTSIIPLNEGYQVSLIPSNNTLNIEVGRNVGVPLPCGDFRDITDDCSVTVSAVNGATPTKTGNAINFVGANHVNIYDDPNNNRIYIGYDFTTEDVPAQTLPIPTTVI